MRRIWPVIALLGGLLALGPAATRAEALPRDFFGIAPQATITDADAQYMAAGGIEAIRTLIPWSTVQPTPAPVYNWEPIDEAVATAARGNMRVLPFLISTPPWLGKTVTSLPIDDAAERAAWVNFVTAAVQRYGSAGTFWAEHGPSSPEPLPALPVRDWQIWNEANFFYFTFPVSPRRYAELVKLTAPAVKWADPGAKVVLAGLFGKPDLGGAWGMRATRFLAKLYRVPGIRRYFDGVALHPYARDQEVLKEMVEGAREVIEANGDNASLYITEMGWGSESNVKQVAFEQGPIGQARQLRRAYKYLIENRIRLGLKGVYWFSWKDLAESCSFCDSVGLFAGGPGFVPKPAWRSFVGLTGGRAIP